MEILNFNDYNRERCSVLTNAVLDAQVSTFKNFKSENPTGEKTILDVLTYISNPDVGKHFEFIRAIEDKKERDKYKGSVYAISTSATFATRSKDVPIEMRIRVYNGLIWLDIDGVTNLLELKEQLMHIPFVVAVFVTFSGRGLCAVVSTDNTDFTKHEEYCNALYADMLERGIVVDTACKDVTRLRVLSYDGGILLNPNPVKFTLPEPMESVEDEPEEDINIEPDEGERLIRWCVDEFCRRASQEPEGSDKYYIGKGFGGGDYYRYFFTIGMVIARIFGERGLELIDRMCQFSPHYDKAQVAEYYRGFLQGADRPNGNKLGLPSLLNLFESVWGIVPPKEEIIHLPMEGLTPWVRTIVESLATTFQCPVEFVFVAVVSAVCALVGKKVHSWDGRYRNYPSLWLCIVARPGSNKTSPVSFIFKPLQKIQSRIIEEHRAEMKRYREDGCKGDKPIEKALLIADTTPEKRNQLLESSPNGLLMKTDEIGSHIMNLGRYNKSGEIQDELSMWSGEDITVHRQGSDTVRIESPCYSMIGTTQPEQLPRMFGGQDFSGNGYLGRMLWVWNGDEDIPDYSRERIDPSIERSWLEAVDFFSCMPTIGEVTFTEDALLLYEDFINGLRARKRSSRCTEGEAEILGKLEIQCQRWSLAVFLMERYQAHLSGDIPPTCIDGRMMAYSISCMSYFSKSGIKVMKKIGSPSFGRRKDITDGEALRRVIEAYPGHTQKEWAEFTGTTQPYISKILKQTNNGK